jgi:predicted ATPase
LHLQKLYDHLKDYEPSVEYSYRIGRITQALRSSDDATTISTHDRNGRRGVWQSLLAKKNKESLALTRVLTNHEEAMQLKSPKGLMLHGEVGTGKSMLIDLFADCLPNRKKRRWHFNSFMLETLSKLENLRRSKLQSTKSLGQTESEDEYPLLWLARDMINTSPILFLDEFQLPDRTASKIISNLMTGFFQLGGVLIATSNRMPDDLAKAAGVEFVRPTFRFESLTWSWGLQSNNDRNAKIFTGQGEFANFLELLRARCDIWEMEGTKDYRRCEPSQVQHQADDFSSLGAIRMTGEEATYDSESFTATPESPTHYYVESSVASEPSSQASWLDAFNKAQLQAVGDVATSAEDIPWKSALIRVYGRDVLIPRACNGIASFTFAELCGANLGSADYISLASSYHTIILKQVPILNIVRKNEARRFITLLDALYEARCKLLISATAGPDDLFFPETRRSATNDDSSRTTIANITNENSVYPETFSEVYQDLTVPFRPNVSSYSGPDTTHGRLQGVLSEDALEDYPPGRIKRGASHSDLIENQNFEVRRTPDFTQTGTFTGEDEKFAYKRAASRLWEMCGAKWWARQEEGWWRPAPLEVRRWERSVDDQLHEARAGAKTGRREQTPEGMGSAREINEKDDEVICKHGASPFRTVNEPPPKFSFEHIWGTVRWGKKAGPWGQGPEGLKDRKKSDGDV